MKKYTLIFLGLVFFYSSLQAQTTTKYGNYAGGSDTRYGTYFGYKSGYLSTGIKHTVVGLDAGAYSKGDEVVFLGVQAGRNSQGNANVFVGSFSGESSNGKINTFVGYRSGYFSKGDDNTFIGFDTGVRNIGASNTSLGYRAGSSNQGDKNVFLGATSGVANLGDNGVFIGYEAGYHNRGRENTSIGYFSARKANYGHYNTFLGAYAGYASENGSSNTFIGHSSGKFAKAGLRNTFIGSNSGVSNQGSRNVFIGYGAGQYESGSSKLHIANSPTGTIIYGDFEKKQVAIGGKVDSDYTLHVLGNVFSTGNWTSSDKRFKKNINKIEDPAEKLLAVNGVSYEFNQETDTLRKFQEGKTYGFIAQEVKEVMPALVREDKDGYLSLNYECFIPLLVEGYKEMKIENIRLSDQNIDLINRIKILEEKAGIITDTEDDVLGQSRILHQNIPNPFEQSTEIRYEVPQTAKQISLYIYDLKGNELLQFNNLKAGEGAVLIEAHQLKAGMYLYSLIADGQVLATKRMILTNSLR